MSQYRHLNTAEVSGSIPMSPLSGRRRRRKWFRMAEVETKFNALASRRLLGHYCRVSTPPPSTPPAPDGEDLRGLARGMRQLLELAAQTLSAEAGPSGLALRVTGHLGWELTEMVLVSVRYSYREQVYVQRGVDAYLAAHAAGAQWFGPAGGGHRPHEDMLSLLSMPPHAVMGWAGPRVPARAVVRGGGAAGGGGTVGAASYGTAAV